MENITLWQILSTTIGVLVILYLWFWAFPEVRLENFRQSVFSLRSELFDYANAGNIDFSHPAYIRLRTMLNGYLRYSHQLSLFGFLLYFGFRMVFGGTNNSQQFNKDWEAELAGLPDDVKKKLDSMMERASMTLFHHLFLSSIAKKVLVLTPFVLSMIGLYLVSNRFRKFFKEDVDLKEDVEQATYDISTETIKPVKQSLESFNAGAYIFGRPQYVDALAA